MDMEQMQKEAMEKIADAAKTAISLLELEIIPVKQTSWVGMNIFIVDLVDPKDKARAIKTIELIQDDLAYGASIMKTEKNKSRFVIQF